MTIVIHRKELGWFTTECGLQAGGMAVKQYTTDWNSVTCQRCLRSQARRLRFARAPDPVKACLSASALRLAKAALEQVEWTSDINVASPVCYWCRGYKRHPAMDQDYYGKPGHKPDCPRQLALEAISLAPSPDKEP